MVVFRDLKNLFSMVIEWEERLSEYYAFAEEVVTDERSRRKIAHMKQRHLDNLAILRDVRIEQYGKDEWIRSAPDCRVNEILSLKELSSCSRIDDIACHVLDFERQLRHFYEAVADEIVTSDEKDLFGSLARSKDRQIMEIQQNLLP